MVEKHVVPNIKLVREIGVWGFLHPIKRIGGKIKARLEDFIVEEVRNREVAEVRALFGLPYENKPAGKGEYVMFVMEKFDIDTHSAIKELARTWRISRRRIGFAGNKDARAFTAQFITVWKGNPNWTGKYGKIVIRSPRFVEKRIRLGDLDGNRFKVVVRDCKEPDTIPRSFPNFFGPQRFGSYRFVSHPVGKEILLGNWEKAVDLYLGLWSEKEPPETINARKLWNETKDPVKCLKEFPKALRFERTILGELAKGRNPKDAMMRLPRRLLLLFLHAYQAFLFNKILSKRLEIGIEPVEGDILEDGIPTGPLFGYQVKLAEGLQGEIEREVLEEEGIELELWRRFRISGKRRKMIEYVRELTWEFRDGSLFLSFFLPKDTYATSFLREIRGEF